MALNVCNMNVYYIFRRFMKGRKSELGYKTLLGIILVLILLFFLLSLMTSSTKFTLDFIPKLFRFGR